MSEYVVAPGLTRDRYLSRSDGSVFDTWGGYGLSADFLLEKLAQGRSDTARHNFIYRDAAPDHAGQGWYRNHVECTRCGERRLVSVSLPELNRIQRWCIAPPRRSWLSRIFFVDA